MSWKPARAASSFIAFAVIVVLFAPASAEAAATCACYSTIQNVRYCQLFNETSTGTCDFACQELYAGSTSAFSDQNDPDLEADCASHRKISDGPPVQTESGGSPCACYTNINRRVYCSLLSATTSGSCSTQCLALGGQNGVFASSTADGAQLTQDCSKYGPVPANAATSIQPGFAAICACYSTVNSTASCQVLKAGSSADCTGKCIAKGGTRRVFETDPNRAAALKESCEPAAPYSAPPKPYLTPKLSIDIPDVKFSSIVEKDGVLYVPFLADYIGGLYKFLLGFAVTVAIIMVMVGGFQYVLFSGTDKISAAKERIKNAVIGLVLLFAVFVLLYTVNPQLTLLQPLEIKYIDPVQFVAESGDTGGAITKDQLSKIGVTCDGKQNVTTLVNSLQNKVTYRYGAKGGIPPYTAETKTCEDGKACKDSCPPNTICLDCSGFVGLVAECAGLGSKNESGGTAGIFGSAPKVEGCGKDTVSIGGGNQTLTPGDLLGFKSGDYEKSKAFGHVWIYIGNGQVASSSGASGGRSAGKAVQIQSLSTICESYPLRFVDR